VDDEADEERWEDAAREVVEFDERRRESRMFIEEEEDLWWFEMDLLEALMRRVILMSGISLLFLLF